MDEAAVACTFFTQWAVSLAHTARYVTIHEPYFRSIMIYFRSVKTSEGGGNKTLLETQHHLAAANANESSSSISWAWALP